MTQPAARPTGRARSAGSKSVSPASGQQDSTGATPKSPRNPSVQPASGKPKLTVVSPDAASSIIATTVNRRMP